VSADILGRHHTASPGETLALGERLGARLRERRAEGAVVLLVGPLGAGKTVLARGIARGLGVRDQVISPTYTIISEYDAAGSTLYHVDLYRVEGAEQLENLGLEDILRGPGIVLVEWGEKLAMDGDPGWLRVTLSLADDDGRDILVEGGEQ
jgi:tRNA threonylcarbamoyladenosine biosynthesis protein TsaE